jgi:hypothetical protein
MKKLLLSYVFTLPLIITFSQTKLNDSTYQTRKGELIEKGDTLTLGVGSQPNGNFNYVQEVSLMGGAKNVDKFYSNYKLIVIEIMQDSKSGKTLLKCLYVGKKKPWIGVDPDAAVLKEEVYLPKK